MGFELPSTPSDLYDANALLTADFPDIDIGRFLAQGQLATRPSIQQTQAVKLRPYERQKLEKCVLEKQIAELQALLKRGRAWKRHRRALPASSKFSWKEVAQLQLKNRRTSEAQWHWLKTAVVGRAAFIDGLIALLNQHLRAMITIATQSQGRFDGISLQPSDEMLNAVFIFELPSVFAQTNCVFANSGMDSSDEHMSCHQIASRGDNTSIQIGWKQFFPFGFKRCCTSLWMLATLVHRQEDRGPCGTVDDPGNTVAAKFRVSSPVSGGECEALRYRFVHRRFMETGRMVIVWKASIVGEGIYTGMQMNETGWCVMRPSETRAGTHGQVLIKQEPLHPRLAPAAVGFQRFVRRMVQENREEVDNMAYAMMLDDALKGICV